MKTNHYRYSVIILAMAAVLVSGCSWLKGYGRVRLSSKQDMTIQKLEEDWDDYYVFYAGLSSGNPAGIMFDPKHDGRKLVGDGWTRVEDGESVSKIIGSIETYSQFYPRLYVLLGPDGALFGYVFYPMDYDYVVAKLIDDRTMYVYDLESPVYINAPAHDWWDK